MTTHQELIAQAADLRAEMAILRACITAIEARLAKIEKQLYVPPELVAKLMEHDKNTRAS